MAAKYLIDTSIVIKYLNQTLPAKGSAFIETFINSDCTISFISEIELQVWDPPNPEDVLIYQQFVSQSQVISINRGIIDQTIAIRKNYNLKIADAIIAATAIEERLLIADNDKDFTRVPDLKYLNPRVLS
jgi:tRNA(fMet)-specific endonuclease VapC